MLKFLVMAGLACATGFGVGYSVGWHRRAEDPEQVIRSRVRETVAAQNYAATLSLSVLFLLEKGDVGKAKSQLAEQVVEYQHSWAEYDGVAGQPKILPLIKEAINHSPALREELAHTPK